MLQTLGAFLNKAAFVAAILRYWHLMLVFLIKKLVLKKLLLNFFLKKNI